MTAETEERWVAIAAHATRPLLLYARFSGRASREEFGWFLLAALLMLATSYLLDWLILSSSAWAHPDFFRLSSMALLLSPTLAVTVRRLRDIASEPRSVQCKE
ncbi:DUF805 domain-containing protein [Sphingomonas sp. QA11]|uniref:DUF805 domain-containing protein n=1 Tax=Sphingomonas sp. QA11 TaxID=2950605 RepID=UPI00234B61DF|nr:DUF805 domain-containing protein [Sphingomonas sp. QA11]WCM28754.1 DUF805 domain-containing protein [Sphingomonas sp. QA11]